MGRRRHQHPSVFKTKAKCPQWYFRVVLDVLTGARTIERRESTIYLGDAGEIGKREAERRRDAKLTEINRTPELIQSQVRFSDLAKSWRTNILPTLKPSSRTGYAHRLEKHILPHFGAFRLFEIGNVQVQQWINGLAASGMARSTRVVVLSTLSGIFERAAEWGYFQGRNPCKGVRVGDGIPPRNLRALTVEELKRLFAALTGDEPLRSITWLAYVTGLRVGEILGLTWGAINREGGTLRVMQSKSQTGEMSSPKTARGRRDVQARAEVEALHRPPGAKDSDLVWPDADYFRLQKRLSKVAESAGISFEGFGFHTLRVTYTTLRAAGPEVSPQLSRDLGHASEAMTRHYVRPGNLDADAAQYLRELLFFSGETRESGTLQ